MNFHVTTSCCRGLEYLLAVWKSTLVGFLVCMTTKVKFKVHGTNTFLVRKKYKYLNYSFTAFGFDDTHLLTNITRERNNARNNF